jgi:hypothetical protein
MVAVNNEHMVGIRIHLGYILVDSRLYLDGVRVRVILYLGGGWLVLNLL